MKQYLSRQLWMLAILLFAGIGNAFGAKIITNFDGLPNDCGEVYYLLPNGEEFWPISGQEWIFDDGSTIKLNVNILNTVYSISSVTVNNTPVQLTYDENNAYCDIELSEEEYVVDIEFSVDNENAKTIKVTWDNSNVGEIYFDIPTESVTIHPKGSGEVNYLPKVSNLLWVSVINPFAYNISVIVDNDDVTQDYLNNGYIEFDENGSHEVSISFAAVDSRDIEVNWNSNVAGVYFFDQNDKRGRAQPEAPFKLPKGSAYKMHVELNNPFAYSVTSVKVGTDVVTSDYNTNGYIVIPADDNDYGVDVTIAEAESTNNVTVNWNTNYNVGVRLADQKGNIQWLGSESHYAVAAGASYQMQIMLYDPLITIKSVKVKDTENTEGTEVTVTYNSTHNYYECEIADLNKDLIVDIEIDDIPTSTVTVTWGDDCAGVNFVDENDNWFYPSSGEPETLPTGSTHKMLIFLDDPWTYRPLVTSGGNTVAATFNSNEGRYEYEIGALSQDQNLTFTVSVEQRPTRPVTVTWDYSKVKVEFVPQQGSGDIIKVVSGTACNLTDGIPYRMYVNFPDNNFYSLASITDNNKDVKSDYIDEGNNRGYLDFDAISAAHTVSLGINKSVETNTITIDWDDNLASVQFYDDINSNWFYPDPEDKDCELPTGNTYVMKIYPNNHLVYSVGSVTVDQVGVQEYNGYEFKNLSADHSVAVVFNKVPSNNVTVTWDENNGEVERLFFCDESDNYRIWTQRDNATELPINATVKLRIEPSPGYEVKTLKDGTKDVTADFVDGWYVFENLSGDHIVTIEFGTVETHTITVAYDTDHTNYVYLNDNWVNNNETREFNEGSDVTMKIYCEDGYKPVLTIDNGESFIPGKNQNGQYEYVFTNLIADHNVNITYEQIVYHNITVIFEHMQAQLNTAQNSNNNISSNNPYPFEQGSDVTLVLSNFQAGHKIASIMDGETNITTEYNDNGYYTFENLSSDHVVTVNLDDVNTHNISVGFSQYSQGKVYLESAMTGKEETNYRSYNEGSNVTMTIEPAIGYEVSSIIVRDGATNVETEVVNIYNNNGFKYVFENLSADFYVSITTQKKAMTGIDPVAFTLDDVGMCTYCSEYDLDFTNVSGITAYIASGFNPATGSVVLTKVKQVPAGTGLIISGKPGNYEIPVVETNYYSMNMLTGVVKPTQIPDYEWVNGIECACYILQDDGIFHFSNGSSNPLAANKAYLQIPRKLVQNTVYSPIMIEWDLKGDVDGDGVVDIADAVRIVNFIVGKIGNLSRRIDNSIDNNPGEPE